MKNKEIEELLNELKRRKERYDYCKNNDISFSDEDYKSYLLLLYIEQLEKKAELGEHYKHLYSEVKKQKDDVVKYIKNIARTDDYLDGVSCDDLLRMLGEIE